MDAIKTYLDNVFAAFPQTPEVMAMKREMLQSLEEKYYELKKSNRSENDVVGTIISNFGSIDEIAQELGISAEPQDTTDAITLSDAQAREFMTEWRRGGVFIGFGVWLIMSGIGILVFMNAIGNFATVLGLATMLGAIGIAVAIFIVAGTRISKYENYEKRRIIISAFMREEVEHGHSQYLSRFGAKIAVGVLVILGATAVMILLTIFEIVFLAVSFLLVCIGFSVFLFISAGFGKSSYDILLNRNKIYRK